MLVSSDSGSSFWLMSSDCANKVEPKHNGVLAVRGSNGYLLSHFHSVEHVWVNLCSSSV